MNEQHSEKSWFREPWPWFLMAGPAIVVVAGIYTAVLAVRTDDGLVVDDYYKQGLAINKTIHRSEAAKASNISASLTAIRGKNSVSFSMRLIGSRQFPDVVIMSLVHPTRAGFDQQVILRRSSDGVYSGDATGLDDIQWNVTIEQADWRLAGTWDLRREQSLELHPFDGK
jgi:hypothetical protein